MSNAGILTFAKILVDQGVAPGLTNNDFHKEIQKRSGAIRKAGETDAQCYTRYITDTEDGKLLFKAYRAAPKPEPSDAAADEDQDYVQRGPAEMEMEAALSEHRASAAAQGRHLTREQAFTEVYTSPANRGLKTRYDAETAEATTKRMAGMK